MPTRSAVTGTKDAVKIESHSSELAVRPRILDAKVMSMVSLMSSGQVKGKVIVRTYEARVGRAMSGYSARGASAKPTRVSKARSSDEDESLALTLKVMGHLRGLEVVAALMTSTTSWRSTAAGKTKWRV
jgi:hypothetical protein